MRGSLPPRPSPGGVLPWSVRLEDASAQLPKRLPLEAFPDCSGLATPPGLVFLPLPSLLALRGL